MPCVCVCFPPPHTRVLFAWCHLADPACAQNPIQLGWFFPLIYFLFIPYFLSPPSSMLQTLFVYVCACASVLPIYNVVRTLFDYWRDQFIDVFFCFCLCLFGCRGCLGSRLRTWSAMSDASSSSKDFKRPTAASIPARPSTPAASG